MKKYRKMNTNRNTKLLSTSYSIRTFIFEIFNSDDACFHQQIDFSYLCNLKYSSSGP